MSPPIPFCEPERLRALDRYALLDTPPESEFEDHTALAAKLFDVPIALITLVDADRQWFKSCHGLETMRETPREVAFCAFTILGHHPLVVPDALRDERFARSPLVTGPPHIRFYAGAPLTTSDGLNLGDLCIIDTVPRTFSASQAASLMQLTGVVMAAIEARHTEQRLRREIAVHEQTTRNLRTVEAKYERIAKNSPGMVHQFVRHADGSAEFLFVSDACREILELEPAVLQRQAEAYFDLVHPEDRAAFERAAAESTAGLKILDWEGRYLSPSGRLKWVHLSSHPERLPNGDIYWDGVLLDITAHKQVEAALRQAKRKAEEAQAEAEHANRAKSEFLSRMSHELRTPLNAILGFGQLLEFSTLNEQDVLSVRCILKGGRHLLSLIDEVLDLSRAETGELHLVLGRVDANQLARECVGLVTRLAQARGITCKVERFPVSSAVLWADEQRVRQMLLNLLSNAIKYNRQGGEVVVSSEILPDERMRINVSDSGPGISMDGITRLFVPFERLEQARGEVEGTGLGLVVSRRIAEAMGGSLGVRSVVGRGSTFWIELPLAASRPVDLSTGRPPGPAVPKPETPLHARVLYIEDNVSNMQVMLMLFGIRRPGWKILSADDGTSGLARVRQTLPDLVLLDLQLPDVPGDIVLAELRRDPSTQHIPVVILSADATPYSCESLLAQGADDYISKPFGIEDLLERLDRALLNPAKSCSPPGASSPRLSP